MIAIEKYEVPEMIKTRMHSVCTDLVDDIVMQTNIPEAEAIQVTASYIESIATLVRQQLREQGDEKRVH